MAAFRRERDVRLRSLPGLLLPAVMLLRCELAEALRKWMAREGLTQAQAAKRLGVVQPRISEIARNKVDKLSLDYLVGLCAKAGVSVAVRLAA